MRQMILALLTSVLIAPAAAVRVEAKAETHRHPDLPVQFKTFEGWHRVPRPGDEGTFEMASPSGKAHVMVWYTSTEQDARGYLIKMAGMKGLEIPEGSGPDSLSTEYHDVVLYDIPGTILAVIHNGSSRGHREENALYIVQISCPVDEHDGCSELMSRILGTVRITGEGGP